MWYDAKAAAFASIAAESSRRFAAQFGYAFVSSSTIYQHDRAPAWQRLGLLEQVLSRGVNGTTVDAAIWLDADAALLHENGNQLRLQLETHGITSSHGPDLLFSGDRPSNQLINTGVMVVRNSAYTRAFLRRMTSAEMMPALTES